jgi:hypothetical protein
MKRALDKLERSMKPIHPSTDYIGFLPAELLLEVASYLNHRDLLQLSKVSIRWRQRFWNERKISLNQTYRP